MSERLDQPSDRVRRTARRRMPRGRGPHGARAVPVVGAETEPTLLGFPAEIVVDDDAERSVGEAGLDVPPSRVLTVVRRADPVAAGALVLAGVAAGVSLVLSWSPGAGPTGLSLVKPGIAALGIGSDEVRDGIWQPPVVVASGGLLVLLGLLLLVPARGHRVVGVLALMTALAAAAAVVLLAADSGLVDDRFGPGMWCAVAVPVLGLLGSLKAMLTAPLAPLAPGTAVGGPHP